MGFNFSLLYSKYSASEYTTLSYIYIYIYIYNDDWITVDETCL